ncbi:LuxR C-terminal-related transcriptional regulator [Streptomyces sp. NPDC057325]|uniref:LuxR C-terminal-related transcriptional regulator n=1 Tax=unclassified Streptomyces TaxID=2593676 RepID=UPI00363EC5F7
MSDTETTEAAAIVAATVTELLGRRIGPAEAEQLGTAAIQALRASRWTVEPDPRRAHRLSPLLWSYDPPILAGLARGHTLAEIAQSTGAPTGTVRNRLLHLRRRIGAANGAQAVAIAYQHGWLNGLTPEPRGPITLSGRQHQALTLIAAGHTNDAISRMVGLGDSSVATYIRRLYVALGVDRTGTTFAVARPHAVAIGYQHGLLPLPTAPSATAA